MLKPQYGHQVLLLFLLALPLRAVRQYDLDIRIAEGGLSSEETITLLHITAAAAMRVLQYIPDFFPESVSLDTILNISDGQTRRHLANLQVQNFFSLESASDNFS